MIIATSTFLVLFVMLSACCCRLSVVCCRSSVVGRLLSVVCCLPSIVCLLFLVCCLLSVVCVITETDCPCLLFSQNMTLEIVGMDVVGSPALALCYASDDTQAANTPGNPTAVVPAPSTKFIFTGSFELPAFSFCILSFST
jgi:hypothetical protein